MNTQITCANILARIERRLKYCQHIFLTITLAVFITDTFAIQENEPPSFNNLRFEETWHTQAPVDPGQFGQGPYSLKNLLLSENPYISVSLGMQERMRLEVWENFQFARPGNNNDALLLHRLKAHTDLRFSENVRLFIELKNSLVIDRELPGGRRTSDMDTFAIQNGFVDFNLPFSSPDDGFLRLGRQEILFGKQRLLSPADWSNTRRTFDGLRLDTKFGGQHLSAFWLRPVQVRKYDSNISDDNTLLFGTHYAHKIESFPAAIELYVLGRHKKNTLIAINTFAKDKRYTLGGRFYTKSKSKPWNMEIEAAYQAGNRADRDIRAWMLTTELAYVWQSHAWLAKITGAIDLASGQSSDTGNITLFDPLFPTGHAHLGYIDLIGRFNIIDYRIRLKINPAQRLSISIETHHFNRLNKNDGLYSPSGATVVQGRLSSAREIGSEIDLVSTFNISRHWRSQVGYSTFFAGDFIKNTGMDSSIHFIHLTLQYTY